MLKFTRRPAPGGFAYVVETTGDQEFTAAVVRDSYEGRWVWSAQTFGISQDHGSARTLAEAQSAVRLSYFAISGEV